MTTCRTMSSEDLINKREVDENYFSPVNVRKKALELQNLPPEVLESLMKHVSYTIALQLRSLSSSIHEAVSHKFIAGYLSLLPTIKKAIDSMEEQVTTVAQQMREYHD